MKKYKRVAAVALLVVVFASFFATSAFASDRTALWTRIYDRAETYKDKLGVMNNIAGTRNRDLIPFYQKVLRELVLEARNVPDLQEQNYYNDLTKLVVKELGNLKDRDSAYDTYEVVKTADDPFLLGESIVALGKMDAVEYADEIAEILRQINFNYGSRTDRRYGEIVAYGSVLALERFEDIVGYLPVFFASIGWYSDISRVKQIAVRAMETILRDPTEVLQELVLLDSSFEVKLQALDAEDRSAAPVESKVETAVIAMNEGLRRKPRNKVEGTQLNALRLRAMEIFRREQLSGREAVSLVERAMYLEYNDTEVLFALQTLRTIPDEAATQALVNYLKYQNDRFMDGLIPEDYRRINATIAALGDKGSETAAEELLMVQVAGWPNSIVRASLEALDKLED